MQKKRLVAKVGGSCLKDKTDLPIMMSLVQDLRKRSAPIIVLSAFHGVTDTLIRLYNYALQGSLNSPAFNELRRRHLDIVSEIPSENKGNVERTLEHLFGHLYSALAKVRRIKRPLPRLKDEVVSFGERFAVQIVAFYLNEHGEDSVALCGAEAGLISDGMFGDGSLIRASRRLVKRKLTRPEIPIVSGFFAEDAQGNINTLGRGASDYIACYVASAFRCPTILFKDVPGLLTADPRLVPSARVIRTTGYEDALMMAKYGSKVVMAKALMPAIEANTPIIIRDFRRKETGTTIHQKGDESIAVCALGNLRLARVVFSPRSSSSREFVRTYSAPERCVHISQSSLDGGSVLVYDRATANEIEPVLRRSSFLKILENQTLVSLVGRKVRAMSVGSFVRSVSQTAGRLNSIIIGSSGLAMSVVVDQASAGDVARRLHSLIS